MICVTFVGYDGGVLAVLFVLTVNYTCVFFYLFIFLIEVFVSDFGHELEKLITEEEQNMKQWISET